MKIAQAVKPICPSPIGWLGGKTKLRTTIISCMPEHSSYIEVFCGSATVYFGKPRSSQELINDIHEELILLFKVLAEQFGQAVLHEFVNYVRSMPSARVAHEEWKHFGPKELAKLNPAQRAFRFYYCTKNGFSSTVSGGYSASPLSRSRYNMNTDFAKFTDRMKDLTIEEQDFRVLIEERNKPNADVFFFCDAPYFVANQTNYYENVFTP